jgi:hypothetical protein
MFAKRKFVKLCSQTQLVFWNSLSGKTSLNRFSQSQCKADTIKKNAKIQDEGL